MMAAGALPMVVTALAGLFYLALGLTALARPATLLAGFDLEAKSLDARNEVRAVYGGFPLANAALVGWCLAGAQHAIGILLALSIATLGMALGRVVSTAIDRGIGKLPLTFIGVEIVVAGLLAIGAKLI
jgi:hypothetical protein